MAKSSIEWTQMTWNPTTGCDKLSAGCKYCYAEEMTRRLLAMGQEKYSEGFKFRMHECALNIPYTWRKPLPNLSLNGIHWAIIGGESGRKARPMQEQWIEEIRLQCEMAGVKFFFKQWGGKNKKAAGRILNGRTYDDMPGTIAAGV